MKCGLTILVSVDVQVCVPDGAKDQQASTNDGRLRTGASRCRSVPERVFRQCCSDYCYLGDAQSCRHTAESTAVRAEPKHRFYHEEYCFAARTVPNKTGG